MNYQRNCHSIIDKSVTFTVTIWNLYTSTFYNTGTTTPKDTILKRFPLTNERIYEFTIRF